MILDQTEWIRRPGHSAHAAGRARCMHAVTHWTNHALLEECVRGAGNETEAEVCGTYVQWGAGASAMQRLCRLTEQLRVSRASSADIITGSADGADDRRRRPMVPDDMGALIAVEDPQLSPCGKWVAHIVATPNYEENQHDKQIMLTAVTSGETKLFTFDRPSVGSPRWSPSGDALAFLDKSADGTVQVFLLHTDGGDARQVTALPSGVLAFEWSPTGVELALAVADQPPEKEGEDRHDRTFNVGDDHFLSDAEELPHHLWLAPVGGGDATRLTSGKKGLAKGMGFAWAADGSAIVYPAQENPSLSCVNRRSLEVVPLPSSEWSKEWTLAAGPGTYGTPAVSPDGQFVAYTQTVLDEGGHYVPAAAYIRPLRPDGNEVCVSGSIDRSVGAPIWTLDGSALLLTGDDVNVVSLWQQPIGALEKAEKIALGEVSPSSVVPTADGRVVFLGKTADRPAELYINELDENKEPTQLTNYNEFSATKLELGEVETISWASTDGLTANGIVTYPPGFDRSRKYPMVLVIHGGPMSASLEGFTVRNRT